MNKKNLVNGLAVVSSVTSWAFLVNSPRIAIILAASATSLAVMGLVQASIISKTKDRDGR